MNIYILFNRMLGIQTNVFMNDESRKLIPSLVKNMTTDDPPTLPGYKLNY